MIDRIVNPLSPWRSKRKIPAVTRVLEWTRLETGVGAAMAAGSQELKGYCLLLVPAANKIARRPTTEGADVMRYEMAKRYPISPNRFVAMVM